MVVFTQEGAGLDVGKNWVCSCATIPRDSVLSSFHERTTDVNWTKTPRHSELPDPHRLLQGSGKVHRHVQLRSVADVANPGLKQLLEAALAGWRHRTAAGR